MEDVRRYVSITYLVSGAILAWVLMKTLGLILGSFGPGADRILFGGINVSTVVGLSLGVGVALYCWRNDKIYTTANEVVVELSKVTWPDREDTKRSTWVVIAFAVFLSLALSLFDLMGRAVIDLVFRIFGN